MKSKLLKRIAVAAAFAVAAGTVTAAPKIKGDWLFGAGVQAEESDEPAITVEYYEYTDNDDGVSVTITKWSGGTDVNIPSAIGEKKVTKIDDYAFQESDDLTSVTIPKGVTSIGKGAFSSCSSLTNVTIPDSVTYIGGHAFEYCLNLTEITIPESITSIGEFAFILCGIKSIKIPEGVTSIGDSAFQDCWDLTSLTIPNSVTSIGDGAFFGCYGLTSISIPNSVTSIGDYAFGDCSGLKSITIPGSAVADDVSAFDHSENLENVTILDGATTIGNGAFSYCTGLKTISIPDSVTSIGEHAFGSCSSLTSITLPDSIRSIGSSAFDGCTSLKSITIPNGVTSIEYFTFYGCDNLTSIKIPDSVTEIEYWAFYKCDNLTLFGYADSCAQQYSNEEGIPFKYACEFYSPAVHDIEAVNSDEDNAEYWTCKACGKKFSDENGKTELVSEKSSAPAETSPAAYTAGVAKEYSERGFKRAIKAAKSGKEIRINANHINPVTEDNAKLLAAKKNVTATFVYPGHTLSVNSSDMDIDKAGALKFSSATRFLTNAEDKNFSAAEVRQFAFKSSSFNGIGKATLTVTMTGGSKGKTAKLLLRTAEGKYILIAEETVGSVNRQVSFEITKPGNYIVYTGEADIEYETAE